MIGVYGKLTLQQLVAASKRTKPFKSARQYELIEMEQTAPALAGAQADWEAHLQEAAKEGFRSLQEIRRAGFDYRQHWRGCGGSCGLSPLGEPNSAEFAGR